MIMERAIDTVNKLIINSNWFENEGLPGLIRDASEHKVLEEEEVFSMKPKTKINENGEVEPDGYERVPLRVHVRRKTIPASPIARSQVMEIATGKLLKTIDYSKVDKNGMAKNIPMIEEKHFDNSGNCVVEAEIIEEEK
jgi:hypothetical protein